MGESLHYTQIEQGKKRKEKQKNTNNRTKFLYCISYGTVYDISWSCRAVLRSVTVCTERALFILFMQTFAFVVGESQGTPQHT